MGNFITNWDQNLSSLKKNWLEQICLLKNETKKERNDCLYNLRRDE